MNLAYTVPKDWMQNRMELFFTDRPSKDIIKFHEYFLCKKSIKLFAVIIIRYTNIIIRYPIYY